MFKLLEVWSGLIANFARRALRCVEESAVRNAVSIKKPEAPSAGAPRPQLISLESKNPAVERDAFDKSVAGPRTTRFPCPLSRSPPRLHRPNKYAGRSAMKRDLQLIGFLIRYPNSRTEQPECVCQSDQVCRPGRLEFSGAFTATVHLVHQVHLTFWLHDYRADGREFTGQEPGGTGGLASNSRLCAFQRRSLPWHSHVPGRSRDCLRLKGFGTAVNRLST